MKAEPLVSIYIPTKNRFELLQRAVHSVMCQTYSNVEIIIVDDGSEKKILDSIRLFVKQFKNITLIEQNNMGACEARNRAIGVAKGEFVTGLDDDDIFHPNRIMSFIDFWSDDYIAICSLQANIKSRFSHVKGIPRPSKTIDFNCLKKGNKVGNQIFCKRSTLVEHGFDPEMPALQDWELWLRLTSVTGKKILKIGLCLQYLDTSHGCNRISNLDRRLNALKVIETKYPKYGSLQKIKNQWFFDSEKSLSSLFRCLTLENVFRYVLYTGRVTR